MTYNVRSCRGIDGRCSPARIAEVIASFEPDIVGLQELDRRRPRSASQDQTLEIAESVRMRSHFHPALRIAEEEYGDAILSPHPLRLIRAGALPGVPRQIVDEPRGALWVAVEIRGIEVQVINTHFGLGRSERRAQAAALLGPEWVGAARRAGRVVVCGDLNSLPGMRVHRMFTAHLRDAQLACGAGRCRRTFPTKLPFFCLDYVFLSEGFTVLAADVPRNPLTRIASDHYPLVVDLEISPAAGNAGRG